VVSAPVTQIAGNREHPGHPLGRAILTTDKLSDELRPESSAPWAISDDGDLLVKCSCITIPSAWTRPRPSLRAFEASLRFRSGNPRLGSRHRGRRELDLARPGPDLINRAGRPPARPHNDGARAANRRRRRPKRHPTTSTGRNVTVPGVRRRHATRTRTFGRSDSEQRAGRRGDHSPSLPGPVAGKRVKAATATTSAGNPTEGQRGQVGRNGAERQRQVRSSLPVSR